MKRLVIPWILSIILFFGCKDISNKLHKDLKKVDSLASIAADSISAQISNLTDTVENKNSNTAQNQEIANPYNTKLISSVYSSVLLSMKRKDTVLLKNFLYFPDSVLVVRSQGIFQILSLEPMSALFDYSYMNISDSAWTCQIFFNSWPEQTESGWNQKGCFVQKVSNFKGFSAILSFEKEANLTINPLLEKKVALVEPKVNFKVLNTFIGWTFYFVNENGKYLLVGVDFNQY